MVVRLLTFVVGRRRRTGVVVDGYVGGLAGSLRGAARTRRVCRPHRI